jgi:hypothetical protein
VDSRSCNNQIRSSQGISIGHHQNSKQMSMEAKNNNINRYGASVTSWNPDFSVYTRMKLRVWPLHHTLTYDWPRMYCAKDFQHIPSTTAARTFFLS